MEYILLTAYFIESMRHFVHLMEYLYWCIDIILEQQNINYIINIKKTPVKDQKWFLKNRRYILSFIKEIKLINKDIKFVSNYNNSNNYKEYFYNKENNPIKTKPRISDNFILNNNKIIYEYINWFPNKNSEKMRDMILGYDKINKDNNIKIVLINRKNNRKILNNKELCEKINAYFKINVDEVYFENKTFKEQIHIMNNYNIIISPHGAQLCSIPFSQDNSLIIECAHEEWHPYHYFTGLSYTSNKYHVMICDDHSCFPIWYSKKYINPKTNRSDNKKISMKVNINKIIKVIEMYIDNNNKLEQKECFLL